MLYPVLRDMNNWLDNDFDDMLNTSWMPPSHRLTIRGEKNGKIVEYTFEVDEATYGKYNIGESYP